jgi:hypothetical protein
MLAQEGKGADMHPDNPEHDAIFQERLARVERLHKALSEIRYSA